LTDQPAGAPTGPFQLTVTGLPIPADLDQARDLHNETAGAPQSMAAARALGDLSHNVYTPLDGTPGLLFLDTWTSLDGLGRFFSDAQVAEAAGRLFKEREGVVWAPADGFGSFSLLTPAGRPPVGLGVLRAALTSAGAAREAFAGHSAASIAPARAAGLVRHEMFLRLPAGPDERAPLEILAIDHWNDLGGMDRFYADQGNVAALGPALAGAPATSVWRPAPGHWVEW
jgi:hypothetical protein